jgi:hypothetical protein
MYNFISCVDILKFQVSKFKKQGIECSRSLMLVYWGRWVSGALCVYGMDYTVYRQQKVLVALQALPFFTSKYFEQIEKVRFTKD